MTPLLEVVALSRAFGAFRVTDDVSFSVAAGERLALIGPNGAGKTTLVDLISGVLAPSGGRLHFDGRDITRLGVADRVGRGIVRTFQTSRVFRTLSVIGNVEAATLRQQGRSKALYLGATSRRSIRDTALQVLESLGLADLKDRDAAALAYGDQRLLDLAIALALRPRLLLLDEPAAGVPHDQSGRILEALAGLRSDLAVLMIDHDMDLVHRFADRVLVLAQGRLIFRGLSGDLGRDAEVRRVYLGQNDARSAS